MDLRQEIKEELQLFDEVYLVTTDDESVNISRADNFVGGEGLDGYICDYLGNVCYPTIDSILDALFDEVEIEGIQ